MRRVAVALRAGFSGLAAVTRGVTASAPSRGMRTSSVIAGTNQAAGVHDRMSSPVGTMQRADRCSIAADDPEHLYTSAPTISAIRLMMPFQPPLMVLNAKSFSGERNPACSMRRCVPSLAGVSVQVTVESRLAAY